MSLDLYNNCMISIQVNVLKSKGENKRKGSGAQNTKMTDLSCYENLLFKDLPLISVS